MSDTTTSQRTRRVRKAAPRQIGPVTALMRAFPYVLFGIALGFLLYNPSGYSLYHLFRAVFFNGVGQMTDETGQVVAFYLQPANIMLLITVVAIGGFIYFKWEIARDEKIFLFFYMVLWALGNLLLISLITALTGDNPFGAEWVRWQFMPAIVSALAFGAVLPKVRRAYSGTMTAGGGSFDSVEVDHDHGHHDDDR